MSQIIISRRLHDNGVTMTPKRPLVSIFSTLVRLIDVLTNEETEALTRDFFLTTRNNTLQATQPDTS